MRSLRFPLALLLWVLLAVADLPAQAAVRLVEAPYQTTAVLLFHQVTNDPFHTAHGEDTIERPWVTPKQFDDLLTSLETKGYHYVSLAQATAYIQGTAAALPSKPVLLTFDDGYRSALTEATPILRKHHATAVMFFEGQLTNVSPERLTTKMLLAMQNSGVWQLESHGWIGHGNIVTNRNGAWNPYWYANLKWLPEKQRLETESEFEQRIRNDLRRFKQTFEPALHQKIDVFAYPSGEYGQNGPHPTGADDPTHDDMGHSNANDLTPYLYDALRLEGYSTAFAVSLPGTTHGVSRQDNILSLPRIGVGADFEASAVNDIMANGIQLPELSSAYTFNDPGPIAVTPTNIWVASSANASIYRLSKTGQTEKSWTFPVLLDDRPGNPSLICALLLNGNELTVVQQSGWWTGAKSGHLTRFRIDGDQLALIDRRVLADSASWAVGATEIKGRAVGMTDEGQFVDLQSGEELFSITVSDTLSKQDRFAGPFVVGSALYAYDRKRSRLLTVASDGTVDAGTPLKGDLRNFTASPDGFFAVDWSNDRHILREYHILAGNP